MKSKKCKVSVVIPVYGSEKVLPELIRQLDAVLSSSELVLGDYEVVLVCDRSPDNSWKVIKELALIYPRLHGVLLRMNAGQHNALMAGFARASGEIVITMDDDLQHSPSDIPQLISVINFDADVVYARFKKRNHAFWKVAGSKLNDLVAGYLLQKPRDLYLSPFRAMKAAIRDDILRYSGPYVYVDGLLLSVTRNIKSIDVDHHDRYEGVGIYGLRKSISLWLKMATSFSIVPLRLTSLLGIAFSSIGFILALVFIVQRFTINIMPVGWSSLIVAVLIIGGVQLLALGMIGEYLGRVLLTINSRPQYVVSEVVGGNDMNQQV